MRVSQSGNNPATNPAEVKGPKKAGQMTAAQQAEAAKEAKKASSGASDSAKTEISGRGREMAHAKAVANGAPDVREEKIAELKRRIAAGKYSVDADKIADKMVDDHLSAGIG